MLFVIVAPDFALVCHKEKSTYGANSFILYGKGGEIATNDLENQELTMLALHLLQICLV